MMLSYFYPFSLANAISITTAFVTLWWFVWATKNIVKQRELELRTKYLEDAFYSIQKYSRYTKYNNTWKYPYDKEKLEDWLNRAFNNVKLFGTEEMIERIDILYNDITNKSTNIDLDVTLCYLCSKIRLELGLPKIQKEIVFPWLLINNCDKKNNELQNN